MMIAVMSCYEESKKKKPALYPVDVIFNNPATIVFWNDGTKTVVKCQPGDTYDAETGLMAAMLKRYMGNDNTFNKVINSFLPAPDTSENSTTDQKN